ncbi:hypothetical protein B0H13DRAFT_1855174 [Mycena leptocephala]|nr:hypothetical protein B0H13DRAFT_1855174 [Mycena leptocephala]
MYTIPGLCDTSSQSRRSYFIVLAYRNSSALMRVGLHLVPPVDHDQTQLVMERRRAERGSVMILLVGAPLKHTGAILSPLCAILTSPRPPLPSNTAGTDAEKINTVLALLAELGYPGIVPEDFGKLWPVDEFETEITVMSEVRGYLEVRVLGGPKFRNLQ